MNTFLSLIRLADTTFSGVLHATDTLCLFYIYIHFVSQYCRVVGDYKRVFIYLLSYIHEPITDRTSLRQLRHWCCLRYDMHILREESDTITHDLENKLCCPLACRRFGSCHCLISLRVVD